MKHVGSALGRLVWLSMAPALVFAAIDAGEALRIYGLKWMPATEFWLHTWWAFGIYLVLAVAGAAIAHLAVWRLTYLRTNWPRLSAGLTSAALPSGLLFALWTIARMDASARYDFLNLRRPWSPLIGISCLLVYGALVIYLARRAWAFPPLRQALQRSRYVFFASLLILAPLVALGVSAATDPARAETQWRWSMEDIRGVYYIGVLFFPTYLVLWTCRFAAVGIVAGCGVWGCGRATRGLALMAKARKPAAVALLVALAISMPVTLLRSALAVSGEPAPRGILLITVDALRQDYLSCYGGPVQTRNIDRLAQAGVKFKNLVSTCPWTRPSCASMHLSVYPTVHGIGETGVAKYDSTANVFPARLTTLAEALHAAGITTQGLVSNPQLDARFGFGRGFDKYDTYQEASRGWPWLHLDEAAQPGRRITRHARCLADLDFVTRTDRLDRVAQGGERFCRLATADMFLTSAALRWLRRQGKPFFLWLHYMSVHQYGHFSFDPGAPTPKPDHPGLLQIATSTSIAGPTWFYLIDESAPSEPGCDATAEEGGMPTHWPAPESLVDPVAKGIDMSFYANRYKANLSYLDRVIGCLLDELEAMGLGDSTHIVFTSDHGEEFGDHGGSWHGRTQYEEVVRVPLIIKSPSLSERGVTAQGTGTLTDLAPTILELARVPVPTTFAGVSLLPMARGEDTEIRAAHSEFLEDRKAERKALRWRSLKCISAGGGKDPELYDLALDPREQQNLAKEHPKGLEEMLALLAKWEKEQKLIAAAVRKGGQSRVSIDADTAEMLKTLGYLE